MGSKAGKQKNSHKSLTDDQMNLLVKTTKFDSKEINEWHNGFIKECPKGKLGKEKFIEVYKQFFPEGKADKFCGHVFRTFDTDDSGEIEFTEFLIAISTASKGNQEEKLKMAFNIYDIDKDGKIDKNEMEKIIEAIYELRNISNRQGENAPSEVVKKMILKLDTDGDGFISSDEFINGCLNDESIKEFYTF